jgi:hypothetical protein
MSHSRMVLNTSSRLLWRNVLLRSTRTFASSTLRHKSEVNSYVFYLIMNEGTSLTNYQSSPYPTPTLPSTPSERYLAQTHRFSDPSSDCPAYVKTVLDRSDAYLLPVYARPNLIMSHGEGLWMWDTEGRQYLDFSAGIAVNALGHGDEGMLNVCANAPTSSFA